jgi:hypothetical protein
MTHGRDALVIRVLRIVLLPEFRPAEQRHAETCSVQEENPQDIIETDDRSGDLSM